MQNGHKDISIDASFMRFIKQKEIVCDSSHQFSDSHAVSGEDDSCILAPLLLKPHIVTYFFSYLQVHLLGNTLSQRNGTDPSGLRDDNPPEVWVEVLRDLCGLAAPSVSANDDDGVVCDCVDDLSLEFENG